MSFSVAYTSEAREDLQRLYAHLLERATTAEELDRAELALHEITSGAESLARAPFIYRKAAENPLLRELLIPFGSSGYVLLYKIVDAQAVVVMAVRHQLEDDYH